MNLNRNIRELKASELPALLSLYHFLHVKDEPLPADSAVEAVWSEALASPRCRYFGGFEGEDLVSSCTIMVIPNLTRGCRPYAVIENVVTHAAHRKRGWGKSLLARALDFAWSQGCYKVMLMTGRKDEETLRFYTSAGFDMHGKQAFIAKSAIYPWSLDPAALMPTLRERPRGAFGQCE
jgi:GNAT superfamily N-acetyltransferase